MTPIGNERTILPLELLEGVTVEARRLGWTVLSDQLFLLVLARLESSSAARRVLDAEGLTAERLAGEIPPSEKGPTDSPAGLVFPPAYYLIVGRAEGFAAYSNEGAVTAEHLLLALLWDPTSFSSQLLLSIGGERERIIERLRALGVSVPVRFPPQHRDIEYGEQVWFRRDEVPVVLSHLQASIAPGTFWGFNYEGDRAWAVSEASIDLAALVAESLDR